MNCPIAKTCLFAKECQHKDQAEHCSILRKNEEVPENTKDMEEFLRSRQI